MEKTITEKTRQWAAGENVDPDPTCYQIGSAFVQNIKCSCGARFVTDGAAMIHAMHCNGTMKYQTKDGSWG